MYNTEIRDFQTQVTNGSVGVIRGYLANAEKARVRGAEFDGAARVGSHSSIYGAAAYTDGKYVTFKDAPPPLEDTGGPQFKDISGSILPGISKWALSLGGEYGRPATVFGRCGSLLRRPRRQLPIVVLVERHLLQVPGRRWIRPAERPSRFQGSGGLDDFVVVPQPLNQDYFELLTAAPGNTGLFVGQPGDRRTIGVTLRVALKARK